MLQLVRGLREPAKVTAGTRDDTGDDYDNKIEYNNNLFSLQSLKQDYKNMATGVAKYGGFYVGRYETSLSNATATSAGTNEKVQSKQGVIPTSAANTTTSMWYGLYKRQYKTYSNESDSIESNMIWGSQYDRILNWAKEGKDKNKITSSSYGNHDNVQEVVTTGNEKYAEDSINNIRDLEGNMQEWTMEAYHTGYRILRGGTFIDATPHTPSRRIDVHPQATMRYCGSRMTLYIK